MTILPAENVSLKKLVHQWMDTAGMKSVMREDKGGLKVMKSFFRCHAQ